MAQTNGSVVDMAHLNRGVGVGQAEFEMPCAIGPALYGFSGGDAADEYCGTSQGFIFLIQHDAFYLSAIGYDFRTVGGIEFVDRMQVHPKLTL